MREQFPLGVCNKKKVIVTASVYCVLLYEPDTIVGPAVSICLEHVFVAQRPPCSSQDSSGSQMREPSLEAGIASS